MPDSRHDEWTVPPVDTTDLRSGAEIHQSLLALLPLVGEWRGRGRGVVASTGTEFAFGQVARFAHDGRPFLAYESRSWLLDSDGAVIRNAWRESGFWRPGAGRDDVEIVLASGTGLALMFTGTAGDLRWEVETMAATPTPTATAITGERRLYAIADRQLMYATELALGGQPFQPHLNAQLGPA